MTVPSIRSVFSFMLLSALTVSLEAQEPAVAPLPPGNTDQLSVMSDPNGVAGQSYFNNCGTCGNCASQCCCTSPSLFGRGLIKPSDHAFDDFISPMTNPVFFEDPRALTEAREIFLTHKVPLAAGGGNVQLYALQLRARISENVSLIATKDGYITSDNPLIDDGWADLSAGLKFNLLRNVQRQRLLSAGFMFEAPTGEADALQGNGGGELNLFYSAGIKVGARGHWISVGGYRIPMNSTDESQSVYWSNHFDVQVRKKLYLFSETNWYHWTRSGLDGPVPGIEGLDLFNLGSPGVAGNDIVTTAVGTKLKPNCHNEIGVAFEFPLTEREDIIDNRLTVDWAIRY